MKKTENKLALWAPFTPQDWMPAGGSPHLTHVPTGHPYALMGVAVREHDLVPCAVYRRITTGPVPVWVRPLTEILTGPNWEWESIENITMSALARTLADYEGME